MGKGTQPPKCKVCGDPHWGVCFDHEAKGAIFDQRPGAVADGAIDATYRDASTKPSASIEGPRATQVVNVGAGGRTKSTAAGKDRRTAPNQSGRIAKLDRALLSADAVVAEESGRAGSSPAPAGTQAPPVDTMPITEVKERLATAKAALAEVTARGTPRKRAPKGTFDRKAYQREKAKERRAREKAEKGKTE